MKKERNSSIEMLRILAMLGIVIMHSRSSHGVFLSTIYSL